ncbi:MAG: hypothetical protein ACI8PB_002282 [Desulforhopalus sp.]|jgi:hypothetical protein
MHKNLYNGGNDVLVVLGEIIDYLFTPQIVP